jgi:phosphoribosylformimino-5-aminoimidazole carboxamide ribotide isomerase
MEPSNPAYRFPPADARTIVRPLIIPMLDIMGGQVVRALAGRRSEYRPVRSCLTNSTEPAEVARSLIQATGASALYVADLDAIVHRKPDPTGVLAVVAIAPMVMCDGGFRTVADAAPYARCRVDYVVGTETGDPALFPALGPSRCILSIDLFDGRVIGDRRVWGEFELLELVDRVAARGVTAVILLDLARVGTGRGTGTEAAVRSLSRAFPGLALIAGGGVRTWDDMERLGDAGADAVLVASALHDGTITLPHPVS